jgi:hypothetical protein
LSSKKNTFGDLFWLLSRWNRIVEGLDYRGLTVFHIKNRFFFCNHFILREGMKNWRLYWKLRKNPFLIRSWKWKHISPTLRIILHRNWNYTGIWGGIFFCRVSERENLDRFKFNFFFFAPFSIWIPVWIPYETHHDNHR